MQHPRCSLSLLCVRSCVLVCKADGRNENKNKRNLRSPYEQVDKGGSGEHFSLVEQVERKEVEMPVAHLTQQVLNSVNGSRNCPQPEALRNVELLQHQVCLASELELEHAECHDHLHQLLSYDDGDNDYLGVIQIMSTGRFPSTT